jgi:hypothetical protein
MLASIADFGNIAGPAEKLCILVICLDFVIYLRSKFIRALFQQ